MRIAVQTQAALALAAFAALGGGALAAPEPPRADDASVWITGADGVRTRVGFDPGHRVVVGAGVAATPGSPAATLELGLLLRSEAPAAGWDVFWKRQHELARASLRMPGDGAATVTGVLYRGLYLRHSREGTLTLPLAPPVAFALPFDIGLVAEVGSLTGPLSLAPAGAGLDVTVVRGEVVADFLRAETPGRWLLVGVGGGYEVGVAHDAAAALAVDHRVSPMTALSIACRGERRDGLAGGGVRAEAARRWSSARGWETSYRLDADAEVTPIAVNDRPISLFAAASAETGTHAARLDLRADLRVMAGIRFSQPLR